jgi:hypothetical protein
MARHEVIIHQNTGATVFLENDLGTTFPVVVDEVVSKQLFKAHTAEPIPAGDYKLVVARRRICSRHNHEMNYSEFKIVAFASRTSFTEGSDPSVKDVTVIDD